MRPLLCFCFVLVVLWSSVQGDHHENDKGKEDHGKGHGHENGHEHGKGHGHAHGHEHGKGHELGHPKKSLKIYHQNANFAVSFYKHIIAQPDSQAKNVFFSPLSVSLALAALSTGAGGHTHQQLFNNLGFNETDITPEEVNEAFHEIIMSLENQKDVDLSVGGALFIRDTFHPLPEFLKNLKRYYHSEGITANFTNTDETKTLINNYVKDKTKGKIPELLDSVDKSAVMYLINYVFFKGLWAVSFNPNRTKEDVFHVNETHSVPVQLMTKTDTFHVYHDKDISTHVLKLYYNKSVSMMLILPEKGLDELQKVFTQERLGKWYRSFQEMQCEIYIPKFSMKTSYLLNDPLKEMGITDMFDSRANFNRISQGQLIVSKVIHKATVEVDEAGSTAAAATAVEFTRTVLIPQTTLMYNKPFMFLITSHATRSILFMGHVLDPSK